MRFLPVLELVTEVIEGGGGGGGDKDDEEEDTFLYFRNNYQILILINIKKQNILKFKIN